MKIKNKNKNKKKSLKKIRNSKKYDYVSLPNKIEEKYCSCLMKVRSKKIINPYGICTQAVYGSQQSVRDKVVSCTETYDFKKYNLTQLKLYCREKKIKGYSKLNKTKLIKMLEKYQNNKIKQSKK